MTRANRRADVAFWRDLAAQYERRAPSVMWSDSTPLSAVRVIWYSDHSYRYQNRWLAQMVSAGWSTDSPDPDILATACGFMAAMVEAGDL